MPTIATTGHMDLTAASVEPVRSALRQVLADEAGGGSGLVGISCLAPGADTLFAEAVLEAGGDLVVVLPSRDYREAQVGPEHAAAFDRLVKAASEVVVMPFATADRRAYEAANAELVQRADALVAVWDGTPPSGRGGGTADAVLKARGAGVPVHVVWPEGASRRGQDPL
ncbi:hypothetical protein GCM10018980_14740 [Streptomyces capoamus]|uniref:Uncharacterized protein n=1 Tax=Streptomyces capoamus TaxID=68183 RepID=A0A919EVX5_9ACTN|nr:hypothetical protein [Streptomyces capoamus]GGW13938.1 hypothetical protein GCM10010501_19770 [Streptomyces libani subsp. rufus]GHG40461.1 hypothetical protein GCM10018980_14740 [Streptomyces capoamus]